MEKLHFRKKNNNIYGVEDAVDIWHIEDKKMEEIFFSYFQEIFTSSDPCVEDINEVLESIPSKVTPKMNTMLSIPFT